MTTKADQGLSILETGRTDPDLKLPADIRATIERGQAAFKNQGHGLTSAHNKANVQEVIISVTPQDVEDRRDSNLDARERPEKGGRRQPPMISRLRTVIILVDHLKAAGVPFGVGPNSIMNKKVRKWLNEKASRSPDTRQSRRKQISGTAVRELLKQVRAEGNAIPRKAARPKRTIQEEARERLKELRARTKSAD